jgi:2-succinyl-5-enolpyruvyl-6-hydroxy-3-cyclohexene-1-carboxylate synthase
VLRFGDMPTSKPLRAWLSAAGAPDQIVIDPPGRWNEPTRRAGALVRADAVAVARALADRATAGDPGFARSWAAAERAAGEAIAATLGAESGLSEPALHRVVAEALAEGDQVMLASSMPVRDAEAYVPPGGPAARWFCNRGANGIDGTMSTATGLARGAGSPTWVVLGDLAFAHDLGGLAAVASAPERIHVVVIDNGGGAIFDFLPQAEQVEPARFERLFTTPSRLDVEAAARAYGIDYREITALKDIGALKGGGSVIAHVRVDREGNVALHRRIAEAVGEAVG